MSDDACMVHILTEVYGFHGIVYIPIGEWKITRTDGSGKMHWSVL